MVSVPSQLWRAYHEQYPPPPPLPATAALPQPSTNDTSSAPNTTTTATDADDETAGGLLPPRLTSSQALFYRLRDFWGQVRGTTSSLSSEAAGSGSKGGTKQAGGKAAAPLLSAERILSEIGILFVEVRTGYMYSCCVCFVFFLLWVGSGSPMGWVFGQLEGTQQARGLSL